VPKVLNSTIPDAKEAWETRVIIKFARAYWAYNDRICFVASALSVRSEWTIYPKYLFIYLFITTRQKDKRPLI